MPLVRGAVGRRSNWSSRSQARELFLKTPFFKAWDPEVLDVYVREGLVETEGGVELKMSGFLEAAGFCERRLVYEMWELLPTIDERVAIRWVMSGRPPKVTGSEEITANTVWRRPKNASNVRIEGAGHLVVQEAPCAFAQDVFEFLSSRYGNHRTSRL